MIYDDDLFIADDYVNLLEKRLNVDGSKKVEDRYLYV